MIPVARRWTLGAVVAIVAIVAGAFLLGVQPHLQAAAAADATRTAVTASNTGSRATLGVLAKVAARQAELEATDADLQLAIPTSLKLNTFTRQVGTIAALHLVTVQSIVPGGPTAYAPPSATAGAAAPAATAASGAASTADTATPAKEKKSVFATVDPSITSANLSVIPMTLVVSGSAQDVLDFTEEIQHMERLYSVDGLQTSVENGITTGTLTGSLYALQR